MSQSDRLTLAGALAVALAAATLVPVYDDLGWVLRVVGAVLEAQSGYPTEAPSDSSDGASTTTPNSRVLLSSEASWRDTPFGRRELEAHPDLYEGLGSVSENGARLASVG